MMDAHCLCITARKARYCLSPASFGGAVYPLEVRLQIFSAGGPQSAAISLPPLAIAPFAHGAGGLPLTTGLAADTPPAEVR